LERAEVVDMPKKNLSKEPAPKMLTDLAIKHLSQYHPPNRTRASELFVKRLPA
jgi:hypothetical protein